MSDVYGTCKSGHRGPEASLAQVLLLKHLSKNHARRSPTSCLRMFAYVSLHDASCFVRFPAPAVSENSDSRTGSWPVLGPVPVKTGCFFFFLVCTCVFELA